MNAHRQEIGKPLRPRLEEIAQQWAADNSLSKLRRQRRRDIDVKAMRSWSLTKAETWSLRNRAIQLKRAAR